MKKRLDILIIVVLVSVGVVAGIILFFAKNRFEVLSLMSNEPTYEGMPMSHWVKALKDPNPEVRHQAAHALARIGVEAEPAVPALAEALKDEEESVRLNAAFALFKIGPPARTAVPELTVALKDKNAWTRLDAAMALRRIGPDAKSAIGALLEAVQDEKNREQLPGIGNSVRQQAAQALGEIGTQSQDVVLLLTKVVQDKNESDESFKRKAAEALRKIDPKAAERAGLAPDVKKSPP